MYKLYRRTLYNLYCLLVVGWKVITTFHLLPRAGSPGSNQLSQKCRSFTFVKRSWTSVCRRFRIRSRNATIGFSGEDRRIHVFMLCRSLLVCTVRPTCVLDKCVHTRVQVICNESCVYIRTCTVPMTGRKSRTLELLAFDEYCRFDTSACASAIKRGSLYRTCASRSIKTAIFIES
jgi:hypothetical protein